MKSSREFQVFISFFFIISVGMFSCDSSHEPTITYHSGAKENSPVVKTPAGPSDYFSTTEKLLETDSLNIEVGNALAANYYASKEFDKAIYHFTKIYNIENKNLTALISLGNLYYDTQQNEKAIEFYEKALKIDDKNINVRCDLATCYLGINLPEKAIKILKENIKMDYNHVQSHYNLSIAYKHIGKNKEANEEMEVYNTIMLLPR